MATTRIEIITDTDPANLQTAVNTFVAGVTTVNSTQYFAMLQKIVTGTPQNEYACLINYEP